jgi:hypothetical protein
MRKAVKTEGQKYKKTIIIFKKGANINTGHDVKK